MLHGTFSDFNSDSKPTEGLSCKNLLSSQIRTTHTELFLHVLSRFYGTGALGFSDSASLWHSTPKFQTIDASPGWAPGVPARAFRRKPPARSIEEEVPVCQAAFE